MTPKLTDEIALFSKLRSLGVVCELDPLMPVDVRRDVARQAIEPVLEITFTVANGKRITMAMKYADTYGIAP